MCIGGGRGEARVFYRPANCPSTSCGVSEVCTSVNYNKPTRVQSLVRTAPAERASRPAPPAPSAPQSRCWAGWGAPLLTWEPRGCSGAGGGAPIALGSKAAVQGRGHDTDRPEQSAEPDGWGRLEGPLPGPWGLGAGGAAGPMWGTWAQSAPEKPGPEVGSVGGPGAGQAPEGHGGRLVKPEARAGEGVCKHVNLGASETPEGSTCLLGWWQGCGCGPAL